MREGGGKATARRDERASTKRIGRRTHDTRPLLSSAVAYRGRRGALTSRPGTPTRAHDRARVVRVRVRRTYRASRETMRAAYIQHRRRRVAKILFTRSPPQRFSPAVDAATMSATTTQQPSRGSSSRRSPISMMLAAEKRDNVAPVPVPVPGDPAPVPSPMPAPPRRRHRVATTTMTTTTAATTTAAAATL